MAQAPLIDSHCHLDVDAFRDDIAAVVERARATGIVRLVAVGAGRGAAGPGGALDLARRYPGFVHATVGVHPHDGALWRGQLDEAERVAADPAVVGIGETGLDFHYDLAPRDQQREAFRAQIALARRARKPLIVHTRSAPAETLDILREERAAEVGGVIHCFSEDAAFARSALDLGFVASFSGLVTFPSAGPILEAARVQPDDAILVETDAPFLAPVPHRGRRNEPAYVARTAAFLARARGVDEDEFRRRTTANAGRVFQFPALQEMP